MDNTWSILEKELAFYGFRLPKPGVCQFYLSSGELKTASLKDAVSLLTKEINDNKQLFAILWNKVREKLSDGFIYNSVIDRYRSKLFICAIKDLAKLLEAFPNLDNSILSHIVNASLERDITDFSNEQIDSIIDLKISIDWVHRLISRLLYVRRLLIFSSKGEKAVRNMMMKEARGVSGPWANLDLPMGERVFDWQEEDENFRGRGRDLRHQRRYRKGLENYNNDGSVGEGHYWRELRNEPFSWYDRENDDPYPTRSTLSRWG